ncbi:hypothetical protein [Pseudomonas baltica]|uniref:hypothetical protein n=1 Tax=Pseudomonas baltica TaxID=2762576 RepID=UPI002898BFCC|nr:hypothetical protein [Pseudomonas baltica]
MNKLNEQAQLRSRLFASLVAKQGANVMPGRYGGGYNNDQLAYQENDGVVTLLLGLKLTGDDVGIQLDTESLGAPYAIYEALVLGIGSVLAAEPGISPIWRKNKGGFGQWEVGR